ncbi:MAG: beta-lactamase family protein [Saprospiraceae bacterium]|nr:beta-lactamase family protein [Saprospiraceae bacterium]
MNKIIFFTLLLTTQLLHSQTNKYKEVLTYYNIHKNFNGVVLAATDGQIDYLDAIGVSNRQSGTNINTKTKFKIASITKTFTAVLILQLYEQGLVDLNTPFGKYFPTYKGEAKNKVTIEQLLTYSSGIPNEAEKLKMKSYQIPVTIDEYIDKYCSSKLEAIPGTQSNYSNTDYIILHKIIELVTGKTYSSVLQEKILTPLQMENTNLLNSKDIIQGLTSSYTMIDSTQVIQSDEPYFIENFFGAGAMYSTVEDLLKFNNGIFSYRLLNKSNTALMIQPNKKLNDVAFGVWYAGGYGIFSKPFIYRTGGILGSTGNWIHSIEDKKTFIVLSNTNATNLYELSEQLYLVSTDQNSTIPKVDTIAKTTDFDLNKIKGTWIIDLKPDPTSEPYLKDFIISPIKDNSFGGEFYGTLFDNGVFNKDWEYLYFAFKTGDLDNEYYHAGFIDGEKITGISYSSQRKFTSYWTGTKKTN